MGHICCRSDCLGRSILFYGQIHHGKSGPARRHQSDAGLGGHNEP